MDPALIFFYYMKFHQPPKRKKSLTKISENIKLRNDLLMQIIKSICICLLNPIEEIKLHRVGKELLGHG